MGIIGNGVLEMYGSLSEMGFWRCMGQFWRRISYINQLVSQSDRGKAGIVCMQGKIIYKNQRKPDRNQLNQNYFILVVASFNFG